MARTALRLGLRWGHLRVVEMGLGERTVDHGDGIRETFLRAEFAVARCTCGGEVKLWAREWRGVRRQRDCGCGVSGEDGARVALSVTVPMRVRREVKRYADGEGVTVSKAVVDLLDAAFEYQRMTEGGQEDEGGKMADDAGAGRGVGAGGETDGDGEAASRVGD